MIALEQARQHLEALGLKQAMEVLDHTLDAAASKQLPYPEMLAQLLGAEVSARRERYLKTKTSLAHLPFQRTLEQFDFGFQPSIDERLLLGPPSVGKTHLAIALALKAVENGQGAYFFRAYDLMEDLRKARIKHNLDGGCGSTWRPKSWWWTSSASGPTTGSRPSPSSRWSQPATNGARSSSHPTRASASRESSWGTVSSPGPCWTGCSITATCSTSGAKAAGSGRKGRWGCSRHNNI